MLRTLLAILLTAITTTTTALDDAARTPSFSSLDLNGDGVLTLDEITGVTRLYRRFQAADLNQDGYLDRAEFLKEIAAESIQPRRG